MINHPEPEIFALKNGIRIVQQKAYENGIMHCCFLVNRGSRDEESKVNGLAHFIEHLLFKGTEKRTSYQLLNRLESVGGEINAYTTKEQTCIHASFLNGHLDRAFELIADIAFRSLFPETEMEKEKGVILDEIESYNDLPEEQILDHFDELIFPDHPLGLNILGTPETVKNFKKSDIDHFIKTNYTSDQVVFGVHGNISLSKLKTLAEKYLGYLPETNKAKNRIAPLANKPFSIVSKKPINQAHVVVGVQCYSLEHKNKKAMLMLNNILGGPGLTSRLNLNIREKHGLTYTIESGYYPYCDSGLMEIYFGTDPEKVNRCLKLVYKELGVLREKKLGTIMLHQAKQKIIGQIALAEESRISVLIGACKSLLEYDKIEPLTEAIEKLKKINEIDLMEVANQIYNPATLSVLQFLPQE